LVKNKFRNRLCEAKNKCLGLKDGGKRESCMMKAKYKEWHHFCRLLSGDIKKRRECLVKFVNLHNDRMIKRTEKGLKRLKRKRERTVGGLRRA
jgi:hypothetical protein